MLKLKFQYFGHLMQRADSLEKTLMLGKIGDRRRRGTTEDEKVGWYHRFNGLELGQTLGDGRPSVLQSMGLKRAGHNLVTEQQRIRAVFREDCWVD